MPDTSGDVKKANYNAKITKIEGKVVKYQVLVA